MHLSSEWVFAPVMTCEKETAHTAIGRHQLEQAEQIL